MVNSGSIIINAMLQKLMKPEMSCAEKFDYVTDYIRRMAGGEKVGFNNSVFLAEREVADRNYALAYYMKENKCFPKGINIKDCMDFWYQVRMHLRVQVVHLLSVNLLQFLTVLLHGSELRIIGCDRSNVGQWWCLPNHSRQGHQARRSKGCLVPSPLLRLL